MPVLRMMPPLTSDILHVSRQRHADINGTPLIRKELLVYGNVTNKHIFLYFSLTLVTIKNFKQAQKLCILV